MKKTLFSVLLTACMVSNLWAAEGGGESTAAEIAKLKAQIAAQQAQLERLSKALEAQSQILESLSAAGAPRVTPTLASTTPMLPPAPATPKVALPAPQDTSNPCEAREGDTVPPYLRVGNTCVTPVGFMDFTGVVRDKTTGSSIGSNFGSVPYGNTAAGRLSEFHFSPQNSRLGFRVDGVWKGAHFIGYNEFDFLGQSGSNAITVTNGAFVPRLRLFWVDVRKDKWEVLGGQSWSMLTPNRKQISALPGDLFYSQVVDVNYMAGLTWTRQPGIRVLYHPSEKVTMGLSLENPDQYIGGSGGGSAIALPGALASLQNTQLDQAGVVQGTATAHPDIIAKIAVDPSSRFHGEIAGIVRSFRTFNPNTGAALGAGQTSTITGGGVQVGLNAEIAKGFRLVTTNYWSDGGGRYLFGQAPDVAVHSDGSLSAIHSGGTVDGFEYTRGNWMFYAYYGGIYIQKNALLDANGTTRMGYGYVGSPNSQNRAINEGTFGLNQTIWKNARYGAINLMWQYEYLMRSPWFVASGTPKNTHDNTVYVNLRYTLPGSVPAIK